MFDMIGGVGVGLGGLWNCWGEWGWRGRWVIQLHLRVWSIYSSMVKIRLHVIDTKNYVKCLGIWHNAAILEKLCEMLISLILVCTIYSPRFICVMLWCQISDRTHRIGYSRQHSNIQRYLLKLKFEWLKLPHIKRVCIRFTLFYLQSLLHVFFALQPSRRPRRHIVFIATVGRRLQVAV